MKENLRKTKYFRWLMAAVWLVIWALIALMVGNDVILPSPVSTVKALIALIGTGSFYLNVLWTILRTVLGIVLSFVIGVFFAVLASKNMPLKEFLRLPVSFFKSIPVMAIIIYVILVVKSDWVAVVVCFFMCFPIAYTNILNGLQALDVSRLELGKTLGLSRAQTVRYIIRPSLNTEIKTALNLITAMSWKVVVASEVLAIPKFSIGYQMLNSKYYLETPDLFAYMIVLIVLSLLMEILVGRMAELSPDRLRRTLERELETVSRIDCAKNPAHISFVDVTKTFVSEDGKESRVLDGFSCEFEPGVTAILAPSGAGKTTMARLITGLEVPEKGRVEVSDSARIGYLFQEDRLLPWLSVKDNMMLALAAGNATDSDAEKAVSTMAEKLEIRDALNMMPDELSGGMAHRAALGRTLLFGGNVLILDEPFRGLDEDLKVRIIDDISDYIRPIDQPKTVLLITHDEDLAGKLADRVVRI